MKTKTYVVYQKDFDGEFTGIVGVYTDNARANDVRDKLNADGNNAKSEKQGSGYSYFVEISDLDPADADIFYGESHG